MNVVLHCTKPACFEYYVLPDDSFVEEAKYLASHTVRKTASEIH